MKIGLFTDTFFPQINGVGTSVRTLSDSLTKLGHEVYIFTPSDPRQPKDEDSHIIRMPSMPCVFIRQFRMGLVYPPVALTKIAFLNLDIIHTQTEFSLGMFGKILSKTLNIPIVHTYHTMYADYVHYIVNGKLVTPSMAKEFSKLFCNSANAVIAPTDKVKNILHQYGVTRPIHIIPTGINIDRFRKTNFAEEEIQAMKEELGISGCPVVLSLGRIAKEKSIDVVIKALPSLLQKLPSVKLVIVGDGPERETLEALVGTLGIQQSVVFTGAKPWTEIGKYYQLGDVFVSASVTETQGLTFIEAMAAGVPVVAKNDECIEGVVIDGKTGLLFNDNEELSHKLYTVLTNQTLYDTLSEHAAIEAEKVSSESFGTAVESLYTDILENPIKYDFHKHQHYILTPMKKVGKIAKTAYKKIRMKGWKENDI